MGTLRIPLTRGKFALIDEEDAGLLTGIRWSAALRFGIWYAFGATPGGHKKSKHVQMHRVIMAAPPEVYVDHWDGDGLNNRRANLRFCDNSQNQQNRHKLTTNTSGYRGVTWNKSSAKWQAGIKHQGKSRHLGLYEDREDAARAYDVAAREFFGEFARLNFPTEVQP